MYSYSCRSWRDKLRYYIEYNLKPGDYRSKTLRNKTNAKKCKLSKNKKQKSFSDKFLAETTPSASPCVPKSKRCTKCLDNHTPFPKFCRWVTKNEEKINRKKEQKNYSSASGSEISDEILGVIRLRIIQIEDKISSIVASKLDKCTKKKN